MTRSCSCPAIVGTSISHVSWTAQLRARLVPWWTFFLLTLTKPEFGADSRSMQSIFLDQTRHSASSKSEAYGGGLATNLKRLGVPETVIQAMLCHVDVSTTQPFYITPCMRMSPPA